MLIENEIWFVGKDIAGILGYSNTRDAISKHVDNEDKGVAKCDTLGGVQNLVIINESGLYSLIISSKLPQAKQFKRWVTSEVIPSIRKYGMYATDNLLDNPDLMIEMLTELKKEREQKRLLQEQMEINKPKVLFAEKIETSEDSIPIGDFAKILKQNGFNIGQNRLFEVLRNSGYLIKGGECKNMPTQKSMGQDLFEIMENTFIDCYGMQRLSKKTKITGKGQIHLMNKFVKGEFVC